MKNIKINQLNCLINQVGKDTAGMYSCMPDNISPATININIIKNKEEQLAVTNKAPDTRNHLLALNLIIGIIKIQPAKYLAS